MADAQQFEAFMRKYQNMVFSTAMRLLANPAEAEDVSQDTFLRAYQGLAGFLERGHRPAVVGVSSTVGRVSRAGWGMYAISKRALEGWLELLAAEWGERGRVYSVNPGATRTPMRAAAVPGVMLGAAYMLRLGQKLAWGEPTRAKAWPDLNAREWVYFTPLAVLVIYIGLAPGLTLRAMDPTLTRVLDELRRRPTVAAAPAEAAAPPAGWVVTTRSTPPAADSPPVWPR